MEQNKKMIRILVTSTSFQDTPGAHQVLLSSLGYQIDYLRGPVKAEVLLPIISDYDGIICGDDEINRAVLEKCKSGKIKVVSKYGIGLDKIDLKAAKELNIPVTNCPGVNQITVAEHVFALILTYRKNIILEHQITQRNEWDRLIGNDIFGKTIGIIGLGAVGKEVAKRAMAFGLKVIAFDKIQDQEFANRNQISYCETIEDLLASSDIISLNAPLNTETHQLINNTKLTILKKGVLIVNTARAGLVEQEAIIKGIENNIISGYLTDVLEVEPIEPNHPLVGNPKVIITPHIGSRTYENVERQGTMAVNNLIKFMQ